MLNKFFYIFFIFSIISCIYAQTQEVYICMIFKGDDQFKDGIYIDENLNIDYTLREERLKDFAFKKSGKEWLEGQLTFNKYFKEFSDYTKLKIGNEFYLCFQDKVIQTNISFYSVWCQPYSGYELHPAFELPPNVSIPVKDYEKNIIICTNNSKSSPLNYNYETDIMIEKMVNDALSKYTNNLPVKEGIEDEPPRNKIIKGSFTSTGKTEYAVSVVKRRSFENFASGIFILDESGKIITEVVPFAESDFYYNELNAIVDYDGDGIYEMLTENGYYEGRGYELWKYNGNKFEKITIGFYWGV